MSSAVGTAALYSLVCNEAKDFDSTSITGMVPPPIRTKFTKKQQYATVVADGESQSWYSRWCKALPWARENNPQEQPEACALEDDDLVCLSPLSQFFCNVTNPPDIYANMTLEGYCTVEELVPPMQHMADLHDRFRRRLVYSLGAWKAEVLENFDVRCLMREVTLDGPDAQQAYHEYMGKLMSEEPLGTAGLPPWDVFCIHYTCDLHRTDVLMRASHIIGDGQLFMKLIKQIMEPLDAVARADFDASITHARAGTPGVGKLKRRPFAGTRDGSSSASSNSLSSTVSNSSGGGSSDGGCHAATAAAFHQQDALISGRTPRQRRHQQAVQFHGSAARNTRQTGQQAQQLEQPCKMSTSEPPCQQRQHRHHHHHHSNGRHVAAHWWRVFVRSLHWCWNQYTALVFSWIMLFWFADPVTTVKASEQQCTGPRRWGSVTISLPEFHKVAKLLGHTLNTLAVTCLAGGVRRYLLRHGHKPARRIRMCGMVDTRSMPGLLPGSMQGASNNFSFIGVPLYTGDITPVERLARVGRAMSWVRHSLVVPLAIRMPDVIQTLFRHPEASSKAILRALPLKTSVGFSNMKGPAGSWALSGYKVSKIHNGVQPMAFGSFISLFSYDSSLTFTHSCFETKTKRPEVLLECILEEYNALRKAASTESDSPACPLLPDSPIGSGKIKAT